MDGSLMELCGCNVVTDWKKRLHPLAFACIVTQNIISRLTQMKPRI